MDFAFTVASLVGLALTLLGAVIGARSGMLSQKDIDARVASMSQWHDDAPPHVRADYELTSRSLRASLWLIAAGTMLQIVGTGGPLIFRD